MRPLTIDDSTDSEIPETLKVLVQSTLEDYNGDDDTTKTYHLFVVLLTTIMMECGFSPIETFYHVEEPTCLTGFNVRCLRSFQKMPSHWWSKQENVYKLKFHVPSVHDCPCLLTVVPLGWMTIVNVVVPGEITLDRVINFKDVHRYVKSNTGVFADLRDLSFKFKDKVVAPIHGRLLSDRGLTNVHLASLPDEILLSVARFLDHISLARLLQTCHRLNEVCRDDCLWKPLCISKFGMQTAFDTYSNLNKNWHAVFSSLLEKNLAALRKFRRTFYSNAYFDDLRLYY